MKKPKYRTCTRNFTNHFDEIEKVDYNFDVDEDETSDEDDNQLSKQQENKK